MPSAPGAERPHAIAARYTAPTVYSYTYPPPPVEYGLAPALATMRGTEGGGYLCLLHGAPAGASFLRSAGAWPRWGWPSGRSPAATPRERLATPGPCVFGGKVPNELSQKPRRLARRRG